jgi:hypothetical protein
LFVFQKRCRKRGETENKNSEYDKSLIAHIIFQHELKTQTLVFYLGMSKTFSNTKMLGRFDSPRKQKETSVCVPVFSDSTMITNCNSKNGSLNNNNNKKESYII